MESGESLVCLLESMQQEVGKIEMIDKESADVINEKVKVLISHSVHLQATSLRDSRARRRGRFRARARARARAGARADDRIGTGAGRA